MGCMNNMARNVVIKSYELEISKNIKKILIDKFLSVLILAKRLETILSWLYLSGEMGLF